MFYKKRLHIWVQNSNLDKILGKLKVTIELNKDSQNNKSNKKLKYAPISKLAIEIKQDKAIEQSQVYNLSMQI